MADQTVALMARRLVQKMAGHLEHKTAHHLVGLKADQMDYHLVGHLVY